MTLIPAGIRTLIRRLGKFIGFRDGRPVYVGTVCPIRSGSGATHEELRRLAKDSQLSIAVDGELRRIFIDAECKDCDPDAVKALAKKLTNASGRTVYVAGCCPQPFCDLCCILPETVDAYVYNESGDSAPITFTRYYLPGPQNTSANGYVWYGSADVCGSTLTIMFWCEEISTDISLDGSWLYKVSFGPFPSFTLGDTTEPGRLPCRIICDPECVRIDLSALNISSGCVGRTWIRSGSFSSGGGNIEDYCDETSCCCPEDVLGIFYCLNIASDCPCFGTIRVPLAYEPYTPNGGAGLPVSQPLFYGSLPYHHVACYGDSELIYVGEFRFALKCIKRENGCYVWRLYISGYTTFFGGSGGTGCFIASDDTPGYVEMTSKTCNPLTIDFTSAHFVGSGFGPTAIICECEGFPVTLSIGTMDAGCSGGSGAGPGSVNTAACPNGISTSLPGVITVTSGSAPGLDGATFTQEYLGNFGGTDTWRTTITVGGHLIYIDQTIGPDGIPHLFIFGAETGCLEASPGLDAVFDCGPPYTVHQSFTTPADDACFPSLTFDIDIGEP
jgi:hypothetical protein